MTDYTILGYELEKITRVCSCGETTHYTRFFILDRLDGARRRYPLPSAAPVYELPHTYLNIVEHQARCIVCVESKLEPFPDWLQPKPEAPKKLSLSDLGF